MTRVLNALICAITVAAVACSGGAPSSPSGGGATISGTVVTGSGGASATSSALTVRVAGTSLSTGVERSGGFKLGGVPPGDIQLTFSGDSATSTVSVTGVDDQDVIELQIAIAGGTATVLNEIRRGKVVLCHRDDSGYHRIDVSTNAEGAHLGHGDAKPGDRVPGDPAGVFDAACRVNSAVRIQKFTNGQDVSEAPGPSIPVGSPVTWTYVVTNTSLFTFSSLTVTDDRGVAVACPQLLPPPGASITCTGSGISVAGQYRNVGTVTVTANGNLFTDRDDSFYFGGIVQPQPLPEQPKVQLCHRTGNGSFHMIEVSVSAEPAHRGHGDGKVGEAVPGRPGLVFTAACGVQ